MKYFCFVLITAALFPVLAQATTYNAHVELEPYAVPTDFKQYNLLNNGEKICSQPDQAATTIECLADIPDGPSSFTVTVEDKAGNESTPSDEIVKDPAPKKPLVKSVTVIEVEVTVTAK